MNSGFRFFQSCPLFGDPSDYLGWLEKNREEEIPSLERHGYFRLNTIVENRTWPLPDHVSFLFIFLG